MNREERRQRMQRMRRQVMEHNIYRWASNVLGDLRELRLESVEGVSYMGPASVPLPDAERARMA
jgi:trehalose-6-phosphate synthase